MPEEPEIRYMGDLQRLKPEPGDVFVLTVPGPVSMDTASRLKEMWAEVAGDAPLLILDAGCKLGCIAAPVAAKEG